MGARFEAILLTPLSFGSAVLDEGALSKAGSQPPAGGIVSVRLITPLDSRLDKPGTPVEARLTRPIFDSNHRLIFPEGSMVRGEVLDVKASRKWHRNGELAFRFTSIESALPVGAGAALNIDGRVVSLRISRELDDVRINDAGAMRISESKKRFIAPAYALVKAGRTIGGAADPFGRALTDALRGKVTKSITGKQSIFGLPGGIAGAMVPPVGIGLGVYSAARSVFSNFIGRGQDVRIPFNTSMEIRLQYP